MNELLEAGGALAYVIVGVGGLGILLALVLAGIGFSKRRVPLVFFVVLPVLLGLIGSFGAWSAANGVLAGLEGVDPNTIPGAALQGQTDALAADWFARWATAVFFAVGAWAAAVGAISAGDDTRTTPIAGIMAGITTLAGAGLCAFYATSHGLGSGAMALVGVIVVSGLGVTVGSFRRALDEQSHRVAGMRFASSMCMVMAVAYAGGALTVGNRMAIFGAGGLAAQAKGLGDAIAIWNDVSTPMVALSWMAFAVALAIAFFGFFYELGEVVERYTLLDVFASGALLVVLGVARIAEFSALDHLQAVGTNAPAVAMYDEYGGDLTAALLSIGDEVREVKPSEGGFGDVLAWKKNEDGSGHFVRVREWNGSTWTEDETPVESAKLHARRPLIAGPNGEPALPVIEVAKGTADGKVLLLLRANEVKGSVDVPPELGYFQVTFMEVATGDERDLEKELWTVAGDTQINWGPTSWFGEGMDEEPIAYANAIAEDTEAKVLHILVNDRSRVKDLANSCLPFLMVPEGDDAARLSEDRRCVFTTAEEQEVRAAAAEVWPLPEVEKLSMSVKNLEGDQLEPAAVEDRFKRELGGIDYCINLLRDEGEEGDGELKLEVKFNSKGRIGDMQIHEKSKLQSQPFARCVALRFADIEMEMPEPPELAEGEEKPPWPKYEVSLDIKS